MEANFLWHFRWWMRRLPFTWRCFWGVVLRVMWRENFNVTGALFMGALRRSSWTKEVSLMAPSLGGWKLTAFIQRCLERDRHGSTVLQKGTVPFLVPCAHPWFGSIRPRVPLEWRTVWVRRFRRRTWLWQEKVILLSRWCLDGLPCSPICWRRTLRATWHSVTHFPWKEKLVEPQRWEPLPGPFFWDRTSNRSWRELWHEFPGEKTTNMILGKRCSFTFQHQRQLASDAEEASGGGRRWSSWENRRRGTTSRGEDAAFWSRRRICVQRPSWRHWTKKRGEKKLRRSRRAWRRRSMRICQTKQFLMRRSVRILRSPGSLKKEWSGGARKEGRSKSKATEVAKLLKGAKVKIKTNQNHQEDEEEEGREAYFTTTSRSQQQGERRREREEEWGVEAATEWVHEAAANRGDCRRGQEELPRWCSFAVQEETAGRWRPDGWRWASEEDQEGSAELHYDGFNTEEKDYQIQWVGKQVGSEEAGVTPWLARGEPRKEVSEATSWQLWRKSDCDVTRTVRYRNDMSGDKRRYEAETTEEERIAVERNDLVPSWRRVEGEEHLRGRCPMESTRLWSPTMRGGRSFAWMRRMIKPFVRPIYSWTSPMARNWTRSTSTRMRRSSSRKPTARSGCHG